MHWQLYGYVPMKPKGKSEQRDKGKLLKEALAVMCTENVEFIAEFPSLSGFKCSCGVSDECTNAHKRHSGEHKHMGCESSLDQCTGYLENVADTIIQAYNLQRRPAKEILVSVISDLERVHKLNDPMPYALPIMYAMSGNSLKMSSVRAVLSDLFHQCTDRDLHVKAIAFDAQFFELALVDEARLPLTVCRLQKRVWSESSKIMKASQVSHFGKMNHVGDI